MYTRSADGGNSFDPIESLSIGSANSVEVPDISAFANNVYVVWAGDTGILFKRSITNGDNFDPPIQLGSGNGPIVTTLGDNVYVVCITI